MLDVLIPHFNDSDGFALSLASVENQSWEGQIRVVVVDDHSNEAHFEAVRARLAGSPLASELVRNEENLKRPKTRNRLLSLVKADYVAWLDAGDEWYPNKLTEQFDVLKARQANGESISNVWVTCDYDWKWVGGRAVANSQDVDGDQFIKLLNGQKLRAYLWTILCTRESLELVGEFDETLTRLQDLDYFLRFSEAGGLLVKNEEVNAPSCCYHKSDAGRDAAEIDKCYTQIYQKHHKEIAKYPRSVGRRMRYRGKLNSARFAKSNQRYLVMGTILGEAFLIAPGQFMKDLARKRGI